MRYFPQRAPRKMDISLLLKVCQDCLGDLVFSSDATSSYYRCLQCNARAVPRDYAARVAEHAVAARGDLPPQAMAG